MVPESPVNLEMFPESLVKLSVSLGLVPESPVNHEMLLEGPDNYCNFVTLPVCHILSALMCFLSFTPCTA